jgi:hypothetical protein
MIAAIHMGGLIDVKCYSQFAIPLQPSTLVVARERSGRVAIATLRRTTSHFLLLSLTLASDEHLASARLLLLAWIRSMARCLVRMTTNLLLLATRLLTHLTVGVLALAGAMTGFSAEVISTAELLSTNLAAANIDQPALLVFDHPLPTHTSPFDKKGTFGTAFAVKMTGVRYLRMAASLRTSAWLPTWWRSCSTRKWRHQNGLAAMAGDFFEDGLFARPTRAFVTKIIAVMRPTFQQSTTLTGTNVFSLKAIVNGTRGGRQRTLPFFVGKSFDRLALSRTAVFFTSMAATVEVCTTNTTALWRFFVTLVTE